MKPTQMIVGFVRRHAVILLVLVVVFSAFAAWGVTQISVVTTQDTFLSAESEAFKGHRAYEDAFGGDSMLILVPGSPWSSPPRRHSRGSLSWRQSSAPTPGSARS